MHSQIQNGIVRVEGKHADHSTNTTVFETAQAKIRFLHLIQRRVVGRFKVVEPTQRHLTNSVFAFFIRVYTQQIEPQ